MELEEHKLDRYSGRHYYHQAKGLLSEGNREVVERVIQMGTALEDPQRLKKLSPQSREHLGLLVQSYQQAFQDYQHKN